METANKPTVEEMVKIPLLSGVVAGGLTSVVVTGAAIALHLAEPLAIGAGTAGFVTLAGWFWFRAEAASRYNPPAPLSPPQPDRLYAAETETVNHRITTTWNDGKAGCWVEMTGTEFDKFAEYASAIVKGVSMGENHWTGSGAIFSKGEYHRMLDRLLLRGMIERDSQKRNASYRPSGVGGALFRYAARLHEGGYSPPLPITGRDLQKIKSD